MIHEHKIGLTSFKCLIFQDFMLQVRCPCSNQTHKITQKQILAPGQTDQKIKEVISMMQNLLIQITKSYIIYSFRGFYQHSMQALISQKL